VKTPFDGIRRSRGLRAALLTLTLLLGTTSADARDKCIRDSFGDTTVFKRFKAPRAGDCQPLHGYSQGKPCTLHGTVCGSSNGDTLRYGFDYVCGPLASTGPTIYYINRTATGGLGTSCDANPGGGAWGCSDYNVFEIDCSPSSMPFP